jgi:indolepyruvate ferredoxin oxidoreductase
MLMLGYAYQRGLIPISAAAINDAITLNGAAVKMNQDAFLWGRRAAHDMKAVDALIARSQGAGVAGRLSNSLDEMVARRQQFLTGYQNAAYGARYAALVSRVRAWEAERFGGRTEIATAVARYYFKLMAYKDEFEVARLQSAPEFLDGLKQQFEGDFRISYNLAPPGIAARHAQSGEAKKKEFGPWMLPVLRFLAGLKSLRGTAFDIFGYSAERRLERGLIERYEKSVTRILEKATPAHYETAVRLASIPELIRGYGHIKRTHLERAEVEWSAAMNQLEKPPFIELHRAA